MNKSYDYEADKRDEQTDLMVSSILMHLQKLYTPVDHIPLV